MKIIITSQDKGLNAPVDSRFGSAQYVILYETETDEWPAIANQQNLDTIL